MPAIETPSRIALAGSAEAPLADLGEVLDSAGLGVVSQNHGEPGLPRLITDPTAGDLNGLPQWIESHDGSHLIYSTALPDLSVARLLDKGADPEAALSSWLDLTQAELHFLRRYRRRVTLIFAEPALNEPASFLSLLSQRLSIEIKRTDCQPAPQTFPSAILRLVAENMLLQSRTARHTVAELLATALPIPTDNLAGAATVNQVVAELRANDSQHQASVDQLNKEKQALLATLDQTQTKLHAMEEQWQSAEPRLSLADQLENDLNKVQKQLQDAQSRLENQNQNDVAADLEEDNTQLLQQLTQTQEALEKAYFKTNHCEQALNETRQRLQWAEDTVQALYQSKSWKVTRPLRWVLDLFTGASQENPNEAEGKHGT